MSKTAPPRQRERVLIVAHSDGHLEVFAEKHIVPRISRVPLATSRDAERLAEDMLHASLPPIWRQLYWPGMRRSTATLTPLLPSTLAAAKATQRSINELNRLAEEVTS